MNKDTATKLNIPTETVELPSKGLLYAKDNPLSSGKVEMKYMTAREEDILTNQNYIKNGTVLDKLLQALIVSPITYSDLLVGDKNAILIAARVLGYGKSYSFSSNGRDYTVDLTKLVEKEIDYNVLSKGVNEFAYTLPKSDNKVTFKLLTHGDEQKIEAEIKGLQKIRPDSSSEVTTRMKYIITSVNDDRDSKAIRDFVDNYLLAPDARSLRNFYGEISPDINMKVMPEDTDYIGEGVEVPVNLNFFWPDL